MTESERQEVARKQIERMRATVRASAQLESFARAILADILHDRNFFEREESEHWCELLEKFGYVRKELFDPELHGEIDGAEPGDDVWIFTDAMKDAAKEGK